MATLEEIKPGSIIQGLNPDNSVSVISVDWIGNQAVELSYRESNGELSEVTLYRDDETQLTVETSSQNWTFNGDPKLLRLLIEANRISLAHHFDPYLAIHTSLVDPLPHQISAVYGEMLTRQPLRFLLADDPGAGKTIMAGLLIKELKIRGDVERCLVVAPGNLVEQWQDELAEKFDLDFEIFTREMIESSSLENHDRLIVRLDVLARNKELLTKHFTSTEWDLVICDEAHRMSANYFGGKVNFTKRYKVGEQLAKICRHFLLMTATPHNGKDADFQQFMALLDSDRFEGRFRSGVHNVDTSDLIRRLTKEELLHFDSRPLFPERRAYTAKFELSPEETSLYGAVTHYVRTQMNRVERFANVDKKIRNNVSFALQILQRRLASSPAAIYTSLKRRRERLESELAHLNTFSDYKSTNLHTVSLSHKKLSFLDECTQEEIEELEDQVIISATIAESHDQLNQEIETLKLLEHQSLNVLRSKCDTKWAQLDRILDDPLMVHKDGTRRKLIVFTEAKDTLNYLHDRIRSRLGHPDSVATIHGGVSRTERRKIIERFMQDRNLLVLVANDAAGEGVNLQRCHLMVNYDLPWNPNKIEQRFGRIHRIGQTEICHLWNLVAANTREGEVYARLLEKLEIAREALGGRVYDILGQLFEGKALKDLLLEAIQYGEQQKIKAKHRRELDTVVDKSHLLNLLQNRALTNDALSESHVEELRLEMERAEAQRLQPYHVQSFFVEAFCQLGGLMQPREPGRWEITYVPTSLRERNMLIDAQKTIQKRYERICFEKKYINQQPVATFIYPGHLLLNTIINLVQEKYGQLMKQGAIFVDDSDIGENLSVITLLEHGIRDGRQLDSGAPQIISTRLQFVTIDSNGIPNSAGIAPHLNLRAPRPEELSLVNDLLSEAWLSENCNQIASSFANSELAQTHVEEVKTRRLPMLNKIQQEVETRLKKEIGYWDAQAIELKEKEHLGLKIRSSWESAERRANKLDERRKNRLRLLKQEKEFTSLPPRIIGGLIVIPRGIIDSKFKAAELNSPSLSANFSARKKVEMQAMAAVMEVETKLGNNPIDVSKLKIGYDIESYNPPSRSYRFIEVKGRVRGATNVTITRQEIITSLHEPEKFILALVEIHGDSTSEPRYVYGALDEREPPFVQTAIQFNLNQLLRRAEVPS